MALWCRIWGHFPNDDGTCRRCRETIDPTEFISLMGSRFNAGDRDIYRRVTKLREGEGR